MGHHVLNFKNWKRVYESQLLLEEDEISFEKTFPDYKLASAAFAAAHKKGEAKPTYTGKYHHYYASQYNPTTDGYNTYDVKIIGLGNRRYKEGYFPDVAADADAAPAQWDPVKGLTSPTNWPDAVSPTGRQFTFGGENALTKDTSVITDVANINARFNAIPLDKLKIMLTNLPNVNRLAYRTKQSSTNPSSGTPQATKDFYGKLTGNAKAIYDAAVKPADPVPVKKP